MRLGGSGRQCQSPGSSCCALHPLPGHPRPLHLGGPRGEPTSAAATRVQPCGRGQSLMLLVPTALWWDCGVLRGCWAPGSARFAAGSQGGRGQDPRAQGDRGVAGECSAAVAHAWAVRAHACGAAWAGSVRVAWLPSAATATAALSTPAPVGRCRGPAAGTPWVPNNGSSLCQPPAHTRTLRAGVRDCQCEAAGAGALRCC